MSEESGKYMTEQGQTVSRTIAERTIAYRPSLRIIAKTTNGAILLQQIAWYWYGNKEKPFYKFVQPCEHDMYREGDSWTEELSFSYSEFQTALDNFAAKVKSGNSKKELSDNYSVIYWTDADRVTWWQFNSDTFERLYGVKLLGNSEKSNYLVNQESLNTLIGINKDNNKEETRKFFQGKKKSKTTIKGIENAIYQDRHVTQEDIQADNGALWAGRENVPPHLLKFADWWNSKTGQTMKKKVNSAWMKEFTTWNTEEIAITALDEAFEHIKSWKKIIEKPADITGAALAINALPAVKEEKHEPTKIDDWRMSIKL